MSEFNFVKPASVEVQPTPVLHFSTDIFDLGKVGLNEGFTIKISEEMVGESTRDLELLFEQKRPILLYSYDAEGESKHVFAKPDKMQKGKVFSLNFLAIDLADLMVGGAHLVFIGGGVMSEYIELNKPST